MEGFTPAFLLQLIIAVGSAGAVYGAIRADLKNLHYRLTEHKDTSDARLKEADQSIHEIRDDLAGHNGRLSRMEGQNDLAERMASALKAER